MDSQSVSQSVSVAASSHFLYLSRADILRSSPIIDHLPISNQAVTVVLSTYCSVSIEFAFASPT